MEISNYDLVLGSNGTMWLYLSSKWYWVNKPGDEESRARPSLPTNLSYTKFGSLRDIAKDATASMSGDAKAEIEEDSDEIEHHELLKSLASIRTMLDKAPTPTRTVTGGYRLVREDD